MEYLAQLIEQAELQLFFMNGTGLGAALLFILGLAFIFKVRVHRPDPIKWINAWRAKPHSDE